jgi:hypothetical protein
MTQEEILAKADALIAEGKAENAVLLLREAAHADPTLFLAKAFFAFAMKHVKENSPLLTAIHIVNRGGGK